LTTILAKRLATLALAGTVTFGFSLLAAPIYSNAAELEKCYGIAKAGQDDGNKEMEVPGMSSVDYQGDAFKFVTKGTCEEISTPFGPGSLKPLDNRPPKGK